MQQQHPAGGGGAARLRAQLRTSAEQLASTVMEEMVRWRLDRIDARRFGLNLNLNFTYTV